jgi:hypothetical protein
MNLPLDKNISVSKLVSIFRSTSATYKFYWFWAILEAVESGKTTITKREIFARMISLSWYTVNYFKISFGKQDLIQCAVEQIKDLENLNIDSSQSYILSILLKTKNKQTLSHLNHFDKNVPHKFLSPWLGYGSKSEIYEESNEQFDSVPYRLKKDVIEVSKTWLTYFKIHSALLKTYCYWNLTLFLQSRNPNVPDIPNKINRPIQRGSLSTHKTRFWDLVINEIGAINCIYTDKPLLKGGYAVEHFIPYQFVAHDLMWNLIPADSSFNSKKSDKLPKFDDYFDSFYEVQKMGFEVIKSKRPKNRFLEQYLPLFPDQKFERNKFEDHIRPMLNIAHNNGFQYLELL